MKAIKKVKQIIAYEPKSFVDEILKTTEEFEKNGLEVEIQYGVTLESYSALIVGRKVETNGAIRSSKTI